MQMLKDKKILVAIVVIILLLAGGGWYLMGMKSQQPLETAAVEEETNVETLSPESIGLDLEFRKDGKAAKIIIGKAEGIQAIEYQISYQKNQEGEDVPEGLIGDVDMSNMSGGKVETDYREFGTCSSGTCRYDTVTSPIKITLKITKENGKVYQSEKSFELPQ
jgi:hypothetical protein